MTTSSLCSAIDRHGLAVVRRVFGPQRIAGLMSDLDRALLEWHQFIQVAA